jgi:hypothetical protein
LSVVISQPDAALYIQPPTLETKVAVQITANAGWRNGAANEVAPGKLVPAVLLISGSGGQNALHGNMSRQYDKSRHSGLKRRFRLRYRDMQISGGF